MSAVLDQFDARLAELGARIGRLLAADVRSFFPQTVRDRFTDASALADAMDDDALAALKADTVTAAEALAATVEQRLSPATAWLGAASPPKDAPGTPSLATHPPVAEVISEIERTVAAFLHVRGLGADAPVAYRLPMRFIDGENLATLTMNLWKAVQRRQEHRAKAGAAANAAAHGERRRRWDEA
jgi:hypothetical protein